jgi:hypothetical protein
MQHGHEAAAAIGSFPILPREAGAVIDLLKGSTDLVSQLRARALRLSRSSICIAPKAVFADRFMTKSTALQQQSEVGIS